MTLTKIKPLDTIKYNVFRGHLEPVVEQTAAEVTLYDGFLEFIYNYTFEDYDTKTPERRRTALFIRKDHISVGLTSHYHESDPDKKESPRIEIYIQGNYQEFIYLEDEKVAYNIYNKIKHWLNG
jgi:hypothetical protein